MFKLKLYNIFFIAYLVIFTFTYSKWPGSHPTYVFFTLTFTLLLYLIVKNRISVGYFFFAGVLWIGFWLKLSVHIIWPELPWMEPTGAFQFTKNSWDEVVIVASVGAWGVMIAGCIKPFWSNIKGSVTLPGIDIPFPKKWWAFSIVIVSCLIGLNEIFHLVQASIPPIKLDWIWPLQGLFSWFISGGIFFIIISVYYFSIKSGKFIKGTALLIFASTLIAISTYSRGTVVFQSLLIIISFYVYRNSLPRLTKDQFIKFLIILSIGIITTIVISQTRREMYIENLKKNLVMPAFSSHTLFLLYKLPLERWIGLEGVMAMTAHPNKNIHTLIKASQEQRELGKVDNYTKNIALSPTKNTIDIMYATPPSFFAFWYYSGNLWILFFASLFLTVLLVVLENLIFSVSKNPFLSGSMGFYVALQFIHLGTGGLFIPIAFMSISFLFALAIAIITRFNFSLLKIQLCKTMRT